MVSIKSQTILGGPSIISVSPKRQTSLGRPGIIHDVDHNHASQAGPGQIMVSIKMQATLCGSDLICGLH